MSHAFLAFHTKKPDIVYENKNVERVKSLMRSRRWFLFQEKLKRPSGCTKDLKWMEGTKKVKSVDIVIISNITKTQRPPIKIIAKYKTE